MRRSVAGRGIIPGSTWPAHRCNDSIGVGPALEKARRIRGLSLDEASRDTRLRVDQLTALENEDFAALPERRLRPGSAAHVRPVPGRQPRQGRSARTRSHADEPEAPAPPGKLGRIERAIAATRIRDNQRFLLFGAATLVVLLLLFGLVARGRGAPAPAAIPTTAPPIGDASSSTIDAVLVALRPGRGHGDRRRRPPRRTTMRGGRDALVLSADEELVRRRSPTGRGAGHGRREGPGAPGRARHGTGPTRSRSTSASHPARRPDRRRREPLGAGRDRRRGHRVAARADREHERAVDRERLAEVGVDVLLPPGGRRQPRPHRRGVASCAACRSDVVHRDGGLGPTEDDITRDALARGDGRAAGTRPRARARGSAHGSPGSAPARCPRTTCARPTSREALGTIANDRGTAPGLVADLPAGRARLRAAGRARRRCTR